MSVRSVAQRHSLVWGKQVVALAVVICLLSVVVPAVPVQAEIPEQWHVLAAEPEPDTEWSGGNTPSSLLPSPLKIPLPREVPPDVAEIALEEGADQLVLRVTATSPGENQTTSPENLSEALFTLRFILRHSAAADDATDSDVEGVYDLRITLDGLAELRGTGTGTNDAVYGLRSGNLPWSFTLGIPKTDLLEHGRLQIDDSLDEVVATLELRHTDGRTATDRVPDNGHGEPYRMVWAPDASAPIPTWEGVEGVDFAAGPAGAFDASGELYVSYLVYSNERGTETGAYLAHVTKEGIHGQRVGAVSFPDDLHEDTRTRTVLAATDADLHMLYHKEPGADHGSGALVYIHAETLGTGGIDKSGPAEDPSAAKGAKAPFDGYSGQPDIVASSGRTIACYTTLGGDGLSVVERSGSGQWTLLRNIDDARFCRLSLDSDDRLHMAWFRESDDADEVFRGDLVYASEATGWKEKVIAKELRDQTVFWETTGVNGGFDFDLDADDTPTFVYEGEDPDATARSSYDGPLYARLDGDTIAREKLPGLVPIHGNPQLVIWIDHDADGYLHAVSGYGSLDSYGMRSPEGRWYYDTDLDRTDALAFAVDPEGRATVIGTQPHGGTTLEVVQTSFRAVPNLRPGTVATVPGPMPLLLIGSILALLATAPSGLRYTADHAPRVAAPALAFVGGFSRLRKSQVLEHETRDRIVRAVAAAPGASPAELQRDLDIPRSTFHYHLSRLEAEGLLRIERHGPRLHLHPPTPYRRKREHPRDLVERDQRLLEMTRLRPGQRSRYYADELGWHPRTVHERLREMERLDLVSCDRTGTRDVRWRYNSGSIEETEFHTAS